MQETKQDSVTICGQVVPIIIEGGEKYYPISFIGKHILGKENFSINNSQYYPKKFKINFDNISESSTNNIQKCKCLNEREMIMRIKSVHMNTLSENNKQALFELKNYFGCNEDFDYIDVTKINNNNYKDYIKNYDLFIQDCIEEVLKDNENIKWKQCKRCGKVYPLHKNFYHKDSRSKKFETMCWDCLEINHRIGLSNKKLTDIYYTYDYEMYKYYKEHDTINIYLHWLENPKTKHIPKIINNKVDYLKIIKHYFDLGEITKDNLTTRLLKNKYKLTNVNNSGYINIKEIYAFLFGENYIYYPWKYNHIRINKFTYKESKIVFNNYLKENNIIIENIFDFEYSKTLKDAKLTQFSDSTLEFIVEYYNRLYAGYLFKIRSTNYYKHKKNRIFDMKYLVEKDFKINPIEKIPLYITKNSLRKRDSSLYYALRKKNYYDGNLYEWVNECYPNKFIEADFVINPYRNQFDSLQESQIHDILKENFTNIIYNQRNTKNTVNISGMIPDWIIHTEQGCLLVEYFGLYIDRKNNKMIEDYRKRTDEKLKIYSKLHNYEKLFIYPKDLDDNFIGVKDKINNIKLKLCI